MKRTVTVVLKASRTFEARNPSDSGWSAISDLTRAIERAGWPEPEIVLNRSWDGAAVPWPETVEI